MKKLRRIRLTFYSSEVKNAIDNTASPVKSTHYVNTGWMEFGIFFIDIKYFIFEKSQYKLIKHTVALNNLKLYENMHIIIACVCE